MKVLDQKLSFPDATEQITAGVPYADVLFSETCAAGNWINVYSNSGTANARKANATDDTKPVDGYVLLAVTSGNVGRVYFGGINTAVTGQTVGDIFLSTTGGAGSSSAAAATNNIYQRVGYAFSATAVIFQRGIPIKRA